MTKTLQGYPGCPYNILKRREVDGLAPENQEAADTLARIDKQQEAKACDLGSCALSGSDMKSVINPRDVSTEWLSVIASVALPSCGFGEDAGNTVETRITFDDIVNPEA